jgi:serine/threonine protein kinase
MYKPEQEIGPYTLIREVGRGSFAVVWLAEQRTEFVTTQVAAKLPHVGSIDMNEFRKEAQIWVRASGHSNVLPLITAGVFSDQVLIASQFVEEGTLAKFLQRSGARVRLNVALDLVVGILKGLRHLHGKGIVHRDLKPANILLQAGEPMIADFGLARVVLTTNTTFQFAGTPAYMAPEIWENNERTFQGDLWAVGVIFYEMLMGQRPFFGEGYLQLARAIACNVPRPLPDSIPGTVRFIVNRALEKQRSHRYQSADEMLDAIARLPKMIACDKCGTFNPIRCATCDRCFTCHGDKPGWLNKIMFGDGYNCGSCRTDPGDFAS